jgi:hypothetical protein
MKPKLILLVVIIFCKLIPVKAQWYVDMSCVAKHYGGDAPSIAGPYKTQAEAQNYITNVFPCACCRVYEQGNSSGSTSTSTTGNPSDNLTNTSVQAITTGLINNDASSLGLGFLGLGLGALINSSQQPSKDQQNALAAQQAAQAAAERAAADRAAAEKAAADKAAADALAAQQERDRKEAEALAKQKAIMSELQPLDQGDPNTVDLSDKKSMVPTTPNSSGTVSQSLGLVSLDDSPAPLLHSANDDINQEKWNKENLPNMTLLTNNTISANITPEESYGESAVTVITGVIPGHVYSTFTSNLTNQVTTGITKVVSLMSNDNYSAATNTANNLPQQSVIKGSINTAIEVTGDKLTEPFNEGENVGPITSAIGYYISGPIKNWATPSVENKIGN